MQKSKIEWCDSTWNPVTGCRHGCEYCYARRIADRFGGYDSSGGGVTTLNPLRRAELHQPLTITRQNGKTVNSPFPFGFEPTFHYYRLEEPQRHREAQTIFVCSMADLFGAWVPTCWITNILDACKAAPQHRYMFLTKNPTRYAQLDRLGFLPHLDNFWYGSTITKKGGMRFQGSPLINTFISIEPLLEDLDVGLGSFGSAQLIIIGAETGNRSGKIIPERGWVDNICEAADLTHAAVFMKDSLQPIVGKANMRQELPWKSKQTEDI